MVTSSNSYWFFTVNLWQVKTPLGDDVVPPRDLNERFEKEATPQQQDPPHEESKDSVAEEQTRYDPPGSSTRRHSPDSDG